MVHFSQVIMEETYEDQLRTLLSTQKRKEKAVERRKRLTKKAGWCCLGMRKALLRLHTPRHQYSTEMFQMYLQVKISFCLMMSRQVQLPKQNVIFDVTHN